MASNSRQSRVANVTVARADVDACAWYKVRPTLCAGADSAADEHACVRASTLRGGSRDLRLDGFA